MDGLDRPYGDGEHEHFTVHPELPPLPPLPDTGDLIRDEEEAAAAEAGAIGGQPSDDPIRTNEDDDRWERDPAFRAVEEGGGGWAEGFEQAEGLLVEHAWNAPEPELTPDGFDLSDPGTDVDPDAADLVEEELEDAAWGGLSRIDRRDEAQLGTPGGEADELRSTEVTFDPQEGPDDPGRGPGLAWER